MLSDLSGLLDPVDGANFLPGNTIAETLAYLNSPDPQARQLCALLTSEPRNSPTDSIVLLLPARDPEADIGFIVLQSDHAYAMSASHAICAVTALLSTGMKAMDPKRAVTQVVLDTAAGLVCARADCTGGRLNSVALTMPPAYCVGLDKPFTHPRYGLFQADLAYGGVFYAIIDPRQFGLDIAPLYAHDLAKLGQEMQAIIAEQTTLVHPQRPEIHGLAYVMFAYPDEADGVAFHRACVTMPSGRLKRSACGAGSNALIACLLRRKLITPRGQCQIRSLINKNFHVVLLDSWREAQRQWSTSEFSGRSFVYGKTCIGFDPDDPSVQGFRIRDF